MARRDMAPESSRSSFVNITGLHEQLMGIGRISSEEDLTLLVERLREMDHQKPGA